jgi:HAD superfamily hydrolase (TIGR01549 family)
VPPLDPARIDAIVFDVDGTLYRQSGVRRGMLLRLLRAHAGRPAEGVRTMRALRAYRRAQEHMRDAAERHGAAAEGQLRLACEWTGLEAATVGACVERWMEREPLDLVGRATRAGVAEFLAAAQERGVRLAVLSDYPPRAKLVAMGIERYFEVAVCAQDAEVRAFKPDPRGIEVALEKLGVSQARALYVGDRPEVDAAAAARAGVPCVIIGRRDAVRERSFGGWTEVSTYAALGALLFA